MDSGRSIILLIIRLWVANIFWKSGYLKLTNFDNTIELFTSEHPVPFMTPLVAAISGTFFEVTCSVLLAFGLLARFASLPLIFMTGVIYFTYAALDENIYWALLLATIATCGAGTFSLDYLIKKKFMPPLSC